MNFCLHHKGRQYVGVDLTPMYPEEVQVPSLSDKKSKTPRVLWERDTPCAMGLKTSPNQVIRATMIAEEFMTGFPWNNTNPFRYQEVVFLPGSKSYTPGQPWFYLVRGDGIMSSILAAYVDDQRIHAPSEEDVYLAARQVVSRESYLGIQDAARK